MTKILIFGGHGFIGLNIRDIFMENSDFKIISPTSKECDLLNLNDVKRIIRKEKPEIIINAAFVGVSARIKFSADYIFTNTTLITNILQSCINQKNIKKIIHFGSAAEYGDSEKLIDENFSIAPKNIYATAKAISSLAALQMQREYDLPLIIIRPFYLYGPHNNKGVLLDVVSAVVKNETLSVTKGEQARDYMYVKDLAKIILRICQQPELFKNGEIYNVGTGKGVRLNQVFKIIFELFKKKPSYSYRPYNKYEYFHQVADNKKINKILKMKYTPIAKGMKETIRLLQQEK